MARLQQRIGSQQSCSLKEVGLAVMVQQPELVQLLDQLAPQLPYVQLLQPLLTASITAAAE